MAAGGVAVGVADSMVGSDCIAPDGESVPVGVQGTGWKGVAVGEAFGAAVTNTNGKAGCTLADAGIPHPASSIPARRITWKRVFMCYCEGGSAVVGVAVGEGVTVKVSVGGNVELGVTVVGIGSEVFVEVGKSGMVVVPGMGVRVGTFGTQSLWPA